MPIKTSTFSGWRLSGKDADAFLKQIHDPTPNPLGQNALDRGRPLAEEYLIKGYVTFNSKKEQQIFTNRKKLEEKYFR